MDVDPTEYLSFLPGSDTIGLTDPKNRVGGREILRHAGLADQEDTWGNFAGGFGLDVLTDPATYLSFGGSALSRAGQVAKKAGVLPETAAGRVGTTLNKLHSAGPPTPALSDALAASGKTLAEIGHEPLGYSVGFGLPFSKPSFGLGESGLKAAEYAGKAVGTADSLARKVPILGSQYGHAVDGIGTALDWAGRQAKAIFDPAVMDATTHLGQSTAREASAQIRPTLARYKGNAAKYADELRAAGDPTGEILRGVAEGTHAGPVNPAIQSVAARMRGDVQGTLKELQDLGVNVSSLADLEAEYLPRYLSPLAKPTAGHGRPRQPLVAADPRVSGREPILKDVLGGTKGVNDLVLDPAVYQGHPAQAAAHVRQRYLSQGLAQPQADSQAQALVDWARALDPQYRASAGTANPLRFFGNHPLADYESYYDKASRLLGAADASHELLARSAIDASSVAALPAGAVPLREALKQGGLTNEVGALATAHSRVNAARQAQGLAPIQFADLANQYVPKESAGEVTRFLRGFSTPDAVGNVGAAFDWMTNLTKAYQTAPYLAFHLRNFLSGLWNNYVKGAGEAPGGMTKQLGDAYALLKGGVVEDANLIPEFARRGLTAQEATKEIGREMYQWGVGGHAPHLGRQVAGPAGGVVNLGTDLEGYLARIPGESPKTITGAARAYVGQAPGQSVSWNPMNVAGVSSNADLFPLVAGGRQLGDVVEGVNRGSLFLSLRRQGYSAEQAAKEVIGAHFDYSRAGKTTTEAKALSRAFPFYTYTRNNIPLQIEQMIQRPGGAAGTTAKAALDARQDAGFLPDYLGGGLAVPLGDEQDGSRRYLTRLDTPAEQAFEWLHGGPRWMQNTIMGVLGQANPILKAPLEYATGKQFYTGRNAADMYSMTGSRELDTFVSNSPLSRPATMLRTLADERKWQDPYGLPINLLTGARVTDVDLARQRSIAEREYLGEALSGLPAVGKFETIYPKPGMDDYLSDTERELLRLNKTVEQRAREEAKKKKGAR